ncbi:MAG: hypothetical protein CR967_01285 [Proteobacteria bacterium]|nr:MAG: hypothetical protein CR967_01285 [Pseudomonadota bacterium]
MNKILIVEDELIAAEYLKQLLQNNGFEVLEIVDNGQEAIQSAKRFNPDIVLMDVMLKGRMSGCEAAVEMAKQIKCSILFLSAHLDDEMVEYALEAKAVGYLTKPYNEAQILATLKLISTREKKVDKSMPKIPDQISLKDGFIFKNGLVFKNNKQIELGPKALKLVNLLCKQPNISVSNEQICMQLWGKMVDDRTLRSLIFRIRSLLGENVIKNISGSGYMICTRE